MTSFEKRILHYMDAGFPILYLHTFEEGKAKETIVTAAKNITNTKIVEWDGTGKVWNVQANTSPCGMMEWPIADVLDDCLECQDRQILILKSIDTFIHDPAPMARLKKMADKIHSGEMDATIFILSPVLEIPREIEKYITVIEMDYLSSEEIGEIIRRFVSEQEIKISDRLKQELSTAFKGLSEFEIENILQLAVAETGELTNAQIELIFEQKKQMIKKAGILEMVPLRESIEDIGGLDNLKSWLRRKEKVFSDIEQAKDFGVDIPKGVLIAGVPGCGKSLCAKAVVCPKRRSAAGSLKSTSKSADTTICPKLT